MCQLKVVRSLLVLPILVMGALQPASAQLSKVDVRTHFGATMPVGDFGKYYDYGWNARLNAIYPLRDRFDVVVDLGVDQLRHHSTTYVPDSHIWKYQVEVETDLLRGSDSFHAIPYVGGGAMSYRTPRHPLGTQARIADTRPVGTAGLRLGASTSQGPTWWLSGELNWAPMGEANARALQNSARTASLPKLASMKTAAVTLGFSLPF